MLYNIIRITIILFLRILIMTSVMLINFYTFMIANPEEDNRTPNGPANKTSSEQVMNVHGMKLGDVIIIAISISCCSLGC